jgi:LmbE family N-acetylglucosaminyl deacetylase
MRARKTYTSPFTQIEYFLDKRILFIAAHPDDEILGAGTLLTLIKEPSFLHTTNGAPEDKVDSINAGYYNLEDYSEARRAEFREALIKGSIFPHSCYYLQIPDQGSIYRLEELIYGIAAVLNEINPDIVFTHPYEGGHPDHDTTAFAVHYILKYFQKRNLFTPLLYEFTSYFNNEGQMTAGEFIPGSYELSTLVLNERQRKLKEIMLRQFQTQQSSIDSFPLIKESYRKAPEYNFLLPPHIGKLYYEHFNLGVKPEVWREITRNFIENSDFCRDLI